MNSITLSSEQRDYLVTNILNDSIIWERTSIAMNQIQKVVNPTAENWEPHLEFSSVFTAYPLMGFPNPKTIEKEEKINPTTDLLYDIFLNAINEDRKRSQEDQRNAMDLAEHIFLEWKSFLRDLRIGKRKI